MRAAYRLCAAILLLLPACAGNIQELYEARRLYALERASAAPQGWMPEASITLSQSLVEQALSATLEQTLTQMQPIDVKLGTLKPKLRLERLTLNEDPGCADCVAFKARLSGTVIATVAGIESSMPIGADLNAGLRFSTTTKDGLREVRVQPARISAFRLDAQSKTGLGFNLSDSMQSWASSWLADIEPVSLGTFGGDELPILDLRVRSRGAALVVELLTDAAHGAPLSNSQASPKSGWTARISEQTLLDHARRAAFGLGEITMDVYGEPVSLDLEGDQFTLGLRVWRLSGLGWWREYTVRGRLGVIDEQLTLTAEQVEAGDRSPGARLADPLSTLGERLILKAIEDAAQQALPASSKSDVSDLKLLVTLRLAEGDGDALQLSGDAELRPAKTAGKKPTSTRDSSGTQASPSGTGDAQRKKKR